MNKNVRKALGRPIFAYLMGGMGTIVLIACAIVLLMGVGADDHKYTPTAWVLLTAGPTIVTFAGTLEYSFLRSLVVDHKSTGEWPWQNPVHHRDWAYRTVVSSVLSCLMTSGITFLATEIANSYIGWVLSSSPVIFATAQKLVYDLIFPIGNLPIVRLQSPLGQKYIPPMEETFQWLATSTTRGKEKEGDLWKSPQAGWSRNSV